MNSANTNSFHRNAAGRQSNQGSAVAKAMADKSTGHAEHGGSRPAGTDEIADFSLQPLAFSLSQRAFTILELMIVIGIIGFMTALALPHLGGFTKSNTMTAATHQLLDDVALARQRAMVNRSQVCMVFLPPNFWGTNSVANVQITNLYSHQYSAYALIGMRTVGDQPGRPYVHYLTDWRYLPQGIFISPYQFTNIQGFSNLLSTTNTTILPPGGSNGWYVSAFPTNVPFPFPSTFAATPALAITNYLPYIGFTPSGQLASGVDQFIMLASGSIIYPLNADGTVPFGSANLVETPADNDFSNPNVIHIDFFTGRAKLEHNQF